VYPQCHAPSNLPGADTYFYRDNPGGGLFASRLLMPSVASSARFTLSACPACGGVDLRPVTVVGPHPVVKCGGCGLQFTTPQPSDAELAEIYGPDYILAEDGSPAAAVITRSKRATADHYLDLLAEAGITPPRRLLEIGCGAGNVLRQAARRGYDVTGVEYSPFACARARETLGGVGRVLQGEIDVVAAEAGRFGVCVLCDVIEHVRDPGAFLRKVFALLEPNGAVFIVTPSIDSWSARLLGQRWMEFKAEHLFYFSRATITRYLEAAGFGQVALHRGVKKLSIDYVAAHFDKYPVAGITQTLRLVRGVTPAAWREHPFSIVASGLVAIARKPAVTS
jgi:SAM-dependent methyltransferase